MAHPLHLLAAAPAAAGGFSPLDIAWSKAVWADDPDASYSDGVAASTVRNAGSIAGDFTGTTGPVFRATHASFNSKGVLEFTTNATSIVSCATYTAVTQPWSYFAVGRFRTSGGSFRVLVDSQVGAHGAAALWRSNATPGTMRYSAPTDRVGTAPGTTARLWTMVANGASSVAEMDGTTDGSGTLGTGSSQSMRLGDSRNTGIPGDIDIAFLGLYAGNITTHGDFADLEQWVEDYYGIAVA